MTARLIYFQRSVFLAKSYPGLTVRACMHFTKSRKIWGNGRAKFGRGSGVVSGCEIGWSDELPEMRLGLRHGIESGV